MKTESCEKCKLYISCRAPQLKFTGYGEKGILIIGEQPSREEEQYGTYGRGRYIGFLRDALENMGYDFEKDCYYTTAINCAPTKTRPPTYMEIKYCRERILRLIQKLKPRSILLLGESAFMSILRNKLTGRIKGLEWTAFIGQTIPDQEFGCFITATWHPSYLMEVLIYDNGDTSKPLYERDRAIFSSWKDHCFNACESGSRSFYSTTYTDTCITTKKVEEAVAYIEIAMTWKYMAFDYETTGIKPFRKGHKIHSVSISDGLVSYSFPFFENEEFLKAWKALMLSPSVYKITHNLNFESLWTRQLLGYLPHNLYWDTMIGQHCLHNQLPTSLKYCVYTNFGVVGYDSSIDKYISSNEEDRKEHGTNAFNNIQEADLDEILLYGALDSLFTYKLFEIQKNTMSEIQLKGFRFLVESAITLNKIQYNGLLLNVDRLHEIDIELETKKEILYAKIMQSEEVAKWDKQEAFNFQSSPQLSHLLYNVLKVKVPYTTATGKPSVDKNALPLLKLPFIENILEYRKLSKIKDTYIAQYLTESVDGKINPFFNVHLVDTFRSSSDSVNIQNQPHRDPELSKYLRSLIKPRRQNKLAEYDYKALEVCINACYSQDKNLIKYITDSSSDMHRDSAADCFLLPPEQVTKAIRNSVKGMFVFAELYGSYYAQVAKDLWEASKEHNLQEHLHKKGIKCYSDFERHIKTAEEILWKQRFPEHDEWRRKQWKFYQKHGYVELYTGFRCYGPMKRNNTFNSPVQGSGYHVLQWTLNQVQKKMEKMDKSYIITEIHDSGLFDLHPSEEDLIDYYMWYYGTQKVREHWDWIVVPLTIEKSVSEIDGNWGKMTEAGALKGE